MRQLTATGFWPLFRFDPRRADEGKLPLALDSRPPSDALAETLLNEQRFRRLNSPAAGSGRAAVEGRGRRPAKTL